MTYCVVLPKGYWDGGNYGFVPGNPDLVPYYGTVVRDDSLDGYVWAPKIDAKAIDFYVHASIVELLTRDNTIVIFRNDSGIRAKVIGDPSALVAIRLTI